jgi:arylsulfatase A-like enzyme
MGMMSHVDAAVANITQALTARGLMDNTVIVVTTDNGGQLTGGAGEPVGVTPPCYTRAHDYHGMYHHRGDLAWKPVVTTASTGFASVVASSPCTR